MLLQTQSSIGVLLLDICLQVNEIEEKTGPDSHIDYKFLTCFMKPAEEECLEMACAFLILLISFMQQYLLRAYHVPGVVLGAVSRT